ncbi:MAG: phosphoglycerate dehydrogenase [Deltaproteobacteria bacterium]|nr:phosphoglycerate dehydrogenase [Deltaproteobacteria bacterium]MCZ6549293.1 phosphoglycerate dehydrogenase [Deltaproteobacteria bacterium]MCZ6561848.1 phosphoglycerate dehydrogenase [Deltaproteobacteria bacterium]MCZ6906493.1 phosphoglycerate dehydrogenase [Deltaproteobacteria bacterium]
MKILVSDPLAPQGLELFQRAPGFDVDVRLELKPAELIGLIGDYQGLVIRSDTKVTSEVVEAAQNLKVIGRAGVGVENVDVEAASKKGIVVMNTPGGNDVTTAEHTISLMMSLARHIPQAVASLKMGKWTREKFMGVELCNKTLGIIGLGNVGRIVAERALGFRMKVIAHDPFVPTESAARLGVEVVSLDEIYERSDFITVHTPMTNETRGLINSNSFAKMKTGVRIINCARGGIVDEEDLIQALQEGKVAGAALDVFVEEPPRPDHPLLMMDQVITTPHLGASTGEAQLNVAIAVAQQMIDFLSRGIIRYAVNVPSVSPELLSILRPYLTLAEKLGSLQVQMLATLPKEVQIEYGGEVTQYDVAPLTLAVLKGILTPMMESSVNYVNAPVVARERGIKVIESKSSRAGDFASSITVRVKTKDKEAEVEGAIFGSNNPRIVRINNFYFEAIPEGYILILHNKDVPGVVGAIGTLLGEKGINIAGFELGREKVGGMAISLIHVDESIPKKVLDILRHLPNILSAQMVKL